MLPFPDFRKQFTLTCDASKHGVGAVLSQEGKIIGFYRKAFDKHESMMSAIELGLCGVIKACKNWEHPLLYSKVLFILETDHKSILFLSSLKNPSPKLFRWARYLSMFNYEARHMKGILNPADFLSRVVRSGRMEENEPRMRSYLWNYPEVKEMQDRDPH